ncbi:MAG: aminotransferase class I/II-fold pyridoxal phosphate-dependent enzyme [Planctomycetes bacterium]|nr:aminotransferase class I/II-fold pyridoxal phosphate-dependent enzyme [Planctomycetota bacterium]
MPLDFATHHSEDLLVSTMAAGLKGSEILKIAGEVRELKAQGRTLLDLTVGDFSSKQFRIPARLEELIAEAYSNGESNYPPSNGMPELREAVRRLLARELNLDYPLPAVIVAGGARPLIYATYRAIVNPGETVVYPVPSWNNNHYCHKLGAKSVAVPVGPEQHFLPSAKDLAPHLASARLLALCSPLNPTGTAFSAEALGEICDLVLAENARRGPTERPLYVMYDQVYWMLTFGKVRHVNPVSLRPAMAPFTVFVDGASKSLAATGLRVGWGFGPPRVIQRMSDIIGHVGAWAPRPEQVATARFLDDTSALSTFRNGFLADVRARLDMLHAGFQRMKAAGLPVDSIEPMGAIYLTLKLNAHGSTTADGTVLRTNDEVRRWLLDAASCALVPFQAFAFAGDTGWFRASVGAVSTADIEDGLPRIEAALRTLR